MRKGYWNQEKFQEWIVNERDRVWVTQRLKNKYPDLFRSLDREIRTVKEAFYPQWRKVCRFLWNRKGWSVEDLPVEEKSLPSLVFALPCEAKAVLDVLDRIFIGKEPPDGLYFSHRRSLRLVIVACLSPEVTCFCNWVGGGPFWHTDSTPFLVPLEKGLYLEDPAGIFPPTCEEVNAELLKEVEKLRERRESSLEPFAIDEDFPERLYDNFYSEKWKKLARKCFNCGACTFLCPTCYCFDLVMDGALKGYQLCSWDSCMFPKFTLHASGHNPRPGYTERVRQRVLHKFSYFPMREGSFGCVGCGVCVTACPVNWDIREVVRGMLQEVGDKKRE